jgi:hypothetical protein
MGKDQTVFLLSAEPISFGFYTQEVIRDLVKLRIGMLELGTNESENEERLQDLRHGFLWTWNELKSMLEREDGAREECGCEEGTGREGYSGGAWEV